MYSIKLSLFLSKKNESTLNIKGLGEKNLKISYYFRKGDLQGRTITLKGGAYPLKPVNVFLGIPYALPPTGVWR